MTPWHMSEIQSSYQHERHLQIGLGLSHITLWNISTPQQISLKYNKDACLKLIVKAGLSGKTYSNTKPVPKTAILQNVG